MRQSKFKCHIPHMDEHCSKIEQVAKAYMYYKFLHNKMKIF